MQALLEGRQPRGSTLEFTVQGGDYDGRKLYAFQLLDGTTAGHAKAAEITRALLRAIFEAVNGIDPNDNSPRRRARRANATLAGFNGATFLATLEVEAGGKRPDGGGNYRDKNMIGKVLRVGDQGYRKLDQPPPVPIERSAPPAQPQTPPRRAGAGAPAVERPALHRDRCARVLRSQGRVDNGRSKRSRFGVPTPGRRSTMSGNGGQPPPPSSRCARSFDGGTIPPATPVSRLSDIELGWLIAAGLFAWIKTRAEQATAEGWDTEETLRQTSLDPQPWDAGAVAHILPQLGSAAEVSTGPSRSAPGRRTRWSASCWRR